LSWLQLVVLAVVQGITEFLPVSSSAHLILVPHLAGWPDQGVAIDAASHLGTLAAVLAYFWRDVWHLITGFLRLVSGRRDSAGRPDRWGLMAVYIVISTVPLLIVGFAIDRYAGDALRKMAIIAWTMPIFGIVLYLADRFAVALRRLEDLRFGHAITIGCAQALALIPGISRSGITMVTARLLGFERAEAARFSFLLSIPASAAAGAYETLKMIRAGDTAMLQDATAVAVLSALTGILAIAFLMVYLRRATFAVFAIYRVLLGGVLLYLIYFTIA
jgi:undecaprenyl-diphosphatase